MTIVLFSSYDTFKGKNKQIYNRLTFLLKSRSPSMKRKNQLFTTEGKMIKFFHGSSPRN